MAYKHFSIENKKKMKKAKTIGIYYREINISLRSNVYP